MTTRVARPACPRPAPGANRARTGADTPWGATSCWCAPNLLLACLAASLSVPAKLARKGAKCMSPALVHGAPALTMVFAPSANTPRPSLARSLTFLTETSVGKDQRALAACVAMMQDPPRKTREGARGKYTVLSPAGGKQCRLRPRYCRRTIVAVVSGISRQAHRCYATRPH